MRYRAEIDGLRAVAVVPVVLFHAGVAPFAGGFVGVDVFFVISGYLIGAVLMHELELGTYSLARFYERRARRILPALFLVAATCVPFAWLWLPPDDMARFGRSLVAVATFSSNVLFWLESGYFDASAELKPLLHTWSLALEEQYYLLFPPLLALAWARGRRTAGAALALTAAASFALAALAPILAPHPKVASANFYLLPSRAWELLCGALLALRLGHDGAAASLGRGAAARAGADALAALGLGLIAWSVLAYDATTPFPGPRALAPVGGTLLVIAFARDGTLVGRLLGSRAPVAIGLISYSVYLWHQPVLAFARHRGALEGPGAPVATTIACLAVLPLAWLSWRFVEAPFRDPRRIDARALWRAAPAAAAALALVGAAAVAQRGNLWRHDALAWEVLGHTDARDAFVWAELRERALAPFDPGRPERVLVIGDSNAGDLINALSTSAAAGRVSLSAFEIPHVCANLAVEPERFVERLAADERARCRAIGWYADADLRERLDEATRVVLASSWEPWQAEPLAESVARLVAEHGDKFVVFGTKHVELDREAAARLGADARPRARVAPAERDRRLNERLADLLGDRFVDPFALLCDAAGCPLFDADGRLRVYDGFHLTRAGAEALGRRLDEGDALGPGARP